MNEKSIWPFLFEVNILEQASSRESTFFVTIEEDVDQLWVDHSGRFGRMGGWGSITFGADGKFTHSRGGNPLAPREEKREKEEFTVTVESNDYDSAAVCTLIRSVGRSWFDGWEQKDSDALHERIECVYWESVNKFVSEPFERPKG